MKFKYHVPTMHLHRKQIFQNEIKDETVKSPQVVYLNNCLTKTSVMIANYHVPIMYVYRKEYLEKKLRMKFNNEVHAMCVLQINALEIKKE